MYHVPAVAPQEQANYNHIIKGPTRQFNKEPQQMIHSSIPLSVYSPKVRTSPIYVPRKGRVPFLQYNHDVDIVRFRGRYLAAWNANETGLEDVPGQFNFLSVSDDFTNWSAPKRLFCPEACCENPVESDNQWQPSFINYHDEVLYCAWCDFIAGKTYVARSIDGVNWRNSEVPPAPKELAGRVVGFPTNHGLLTRHGTLVFPCSLPFAEAQGDRNGREPGRCVVGHTLYAGMLLSFDAGRTWEWGNPAEAVKWHEIGEKPDLPGGDAIALWEPGIYEEPSGRLGMLIRNCSSQDTPARDPYMKSHHMILHSVSEDQGRSWTKARPIEVDSIISRNFPVAGVNASESLLMVMNDWHVSVPKPICNDRYCLSLFCAPVCAPDLLLPGPLVQLDGGLAFYPNGFVTDNRLHLAYTYPNSIMGAVVETLPDFSSPFLMPRGGRSGLTIAAGIARFAHPWSSLGVVPTAELVRSKTLALSFRFRLDYRRGEDFPLLTLGGKTRGGAILLARHDETSGEDRLVASTVSGESCDIGPICEKSWHDVLLELRGHDTLLRFGGAEKTIPLPLLRKISFGGLYERPEWPMGSAWGEDVAIDLASIILT